MAEVFAPEGDADVEWLERLGDEIRHPSFQLSFIQSLTHRLRWTYLALLFVLLAAWIARVTLFDPDLT